MKRTDAFVMGFVGGSVTHRAQKSIAPTVLNWMATRNNPLTHLVRMCEHLSKRFHTVWDPTTFSTSTDNSFRLWIFPALLTNHFYWLWQEGNHKLLIWKFGKIEKLPKGKNKPKGMKDNYR